MLTDETAKMLGYETAIGGQQIAPNVFLKKIYKNSAGGYLIEGSIIEPALLELFTIKLEDELFEI